MSFGDSIRDDKDKAFDWIEVSYNQRCIAPVAPRRVTISHVLSPPENPIRRSLRGHAVCRAGARGSDATDPRTDEEPADTVQESAARTGTREARAEARARTREARAEGRAEARAVAG